MWEVRRTPEFEAWLAALADERTQAVIGRRLLRVARGNLGDSKPVGEGVSELRVDYGPGFRIYFARRGRALIVLLCGGDKGSQARDIVRAKAMAREV